MKPNDRCGMERRQLALKGDLHGIGLAFIRNRVDDAAALENLADGHGDGLFGHVVERGEPSFAELLVAADIVKIDDDVGLFRVEIRRRVVEGDMAVLTDADEADIDDFFLQMGA